MCSDLKTWDKWLSGVFKDEDADGKGVGSVLDVLKRRGDLSDAHLDEMRRDAPPSHSTVDDGTLRRPQLAEDDSGGRHPRPEARQALSEESASPAHAAGGAILLSKSTGC